MHPNFLGEIKWKVMPRTQNIQIKFITRVHYVKKKKLVRKKYDIVLYLK